MSFFLDKQKHWFEFRILGLSGVPQSEYSRSGPFHFPFQPWFHPACEGASWTNVDFSASIYKLLLPLYIFVLSIHILAIYIPCPTRNSLREWVMGSASRCETVLGRQFLHSWSMFWRRGGIIYLFGPEEGCGEGTRPSKSCSPRKGTPLAWSKGKCFSSWTVA